MTEDQKQESVQPQKTTRAKKAPVEDEAKKPATKKAPVEGEAKKPATKKAPAKKEAGEAGAKKAPAKKAASTKAKKPAEPKAEIDPNNNADHLAELICSLLYDKKGLEILRVDISQKSSIADYFVIASAKSTTGVNALASHIEEKLSKEYKIEPYRKEGIRDSKWAALDYGMVIVHIFHEETRRLYQLEHLWAEGENVLAYKQEK